MQKPDIIGLAILQIANSERIRKIRFASVSLASSFDDELSAIINNVDCLLCNWKMRDSLKVFLGWT